MRVLLVEDQPEMVAALRAALARHDMLVDHAPDLSEAEAIAAAGSYDAIVLDRQLPDGDGLSLIPKLRASGNTVPVLVLTARGELADHAIGADEIAPIASGPREQGEPGVGDTDLTRVRRKAMPPSIFEDKEQ